MSQSQILTDHKDIRRWVEKHGGKPTRVKATSGKDDYGGILRLDFGEPDEGLEPVSWEEFFETFEERELGLLCEPQGESRFNKFVHRRQ